MKKKERLDTLLVNKTMFASREAARTAIMDGAILVDGQKITKAGTPIDEKAVIEIIKSYNLCPYVSRGGLKLEKALQYFAVNVKGRVAIDAGASTGGFSDCLLKNGAAYVYAVDVGHGQLDWSLRTDKRVKVLERINIRNLKATELYASQAGEIKAAPVANLAVMDVSFISVNKTLPPLIELLDQKDYDLILLIKPQFEAGREKVGKGGVVRDFETHVQILEKIIAFALLQRPFILALTYSPIKGPQGNIEYLLHLKCGEEVRSANEQLIDAKLARQKAQEAFTALGAP